MTTKTKTEELPGIFQEQIIGAVSYMRRVLSDYTECVKDKEIATAACSDWPSTVDRLVSLAKLLGELEKVAEQYNLDIPKYAC